MDGWPVWLASLSRRDRRGNIITTDRWTPAVLDAAQAHLDFLLDGLGDPGRQRSFRMCITLCRHRALTDLEHDALPDYWHAEPARDIAGGPVEVLWARGIDDTPGVRPCEHPSRQPIRRDLWLPVDCGSCPPCLARAAAVDGVCSCRR